MRRGGQRFGVRPASLTLAGTLVLGAATVAFSAASHADVTDVEGSAFGFFTRVGLFGGPPSDRGPTPTVSLPDGGSATPVTATAATGDARFGPGIIFTSGPISLSTQGAPGPTGAVTTTADIQTVNTSLQEVFTADRVLSTCTAAEAGTTGSTTITNGTLRISEGADLDSEADDTLVPVPSNPAPNTRMTGIIETVGDTYTFIFNEQTVDLTTGKLTINAGRQILEGPTAIGELIFGQVVCGVTASATTTTVAGETTTTVPGQTTTTIAGQTTTSSTAPGSSTSSTTPGSSTSSTVAATSTTGATGAGTRGSGPGGNLPRTGTGAFVLALLGLALLAAGAATKVLGKKLS